MALSYQSKINAIKGVADTTAVTLQERIDECIKENAAKILKGDLLKTALINHVQFTDVQLTEFALRGVRGAMTQNMLPAILCDVTINVQGAASTDAQLDTAFMYAVWFYAKLIGNGSL